MDFRKVHCCNFNEWFQAKDTSSEYGIRWRLLQVYCCFLSKVEAIAVSVQNISLIKSVSNRIVVLYNSKLALKAVSTKFSLQVSESYGLKITFKDLAHNISLQWVPAHCGMIANVYAYLLIK